MRPLLATLALTAAACGTPHAIAAPETTPTSPVASEIAPPGASAHTTAVRLSPPTTTPQTFPVGPEPVIDCREYLNALPWEWRNPAVGLLAYDVGAACRGWPQDVIDKWRPFVHGDVWAGESGWCWNLLGGGQISTDLGCVMGRVGTGEDAGIGQVTASWWGRNGLVCKVHGYCSRDSVIASPYDSVMVALAVIELGGDQAYCYDDRSRRYHPTCAQFPGRWP